MAKIDLKNATIKIWDGTPNTLTTTAVTSNDGQVVLTAVSKHMGTNAITIVLVDPGASNTSTITVTVTGRVISVELGYDTAIDTTATLLAAAITADTDAAALVTCVVDPLGDGSGIVDAQVSTALTGANSITVKVGEGTLSYTEKTPREFVKDRGALDSVRNADEEPMDVSFDFVWDWIRSESGGTATVKEALRQENNASAWVTTATDACQPYCVGLEIVNAPTCTTVGDEYHMFEEFYQEQFNNEAKDGSVNCTGRCNRTIAAVSRGVAA